MSGAFILKVEPAQVSMIVDQYVISTEHGTTYFRRKTIGSTAYDTDWKQISYPFPDYTTLSTLASALGVIKLNHVLLNITGDDPAINVINLGETQSGFLFLGLGGGASYYPGIYSISRGGDVNTIFAAYGNVVVSSTGNTITINKNSQTRATALWVKIQN